MSEIDRLKAENRELKSRLHGVTRDLSALEQRLSRIENSMVFRFLRWIGPRIGWNASARAGDPKQPPSSGAGFDYAAWARDAILLRRALEQLRPNRAATSHGPAVAVLLDARGAGRPQLERALRSLGDQSWPYRELYVCTGSDPAPWLSEILAGARAEAVAGDFADALRRAINAEGAGWIALMSPSVELEPDALARMIAAVRHDSIAVYSDWDRVDASGRYHSPCFTPECSPELLRHAAYWGDCFLVRASALEGLGWTGGAFPELALQLAETARPVQRVAQILWHEQLDAPAAGIPLSLCPVVPPAGPATVSVIICSRRPALLKACLESLFPTLGPGCEVVVLAHGQGGEGAEIERVAQGFGARTVRYDGPFHFGVMNRLAAAQCSGSMLCLLNDDVRPITPDWLARMQELAARPRAGVVGALLLYPDQTIQHAGVVLGDGALPAHAGRSLTDSSYWPWLRITREVTAVTGACLLLRREVWDELGGFDLRFPVNYNDIDLCLRAAERGYRVLLQAEAVLTHAESQTRDPRIRPEEESLFREVWSHVMPNTDRYFNPQLNLCEGAISVRSQRPMEHASGLDDSYLLNPSEAGSWNRAGAAR